MAVLSTRTKSVIASALVAPEDDVYPDRSATDVSIKTGDAIMRNNVWPTSKDMNKLFEWKKGQEVRGTHAKEHAGMKGYRKDIDGAPKESDYKPFFVDTLKPIGDQLKNK